ncbi:MAG: TolC family protein [Gemmatimonadota bacterium]
MRIHILLATMALNAAAMSPAVAQDSTRARVSARDSSVAQDRAREPSVTLAEAIALAEKVQPTVVQAQGNIRNASAQLRAARGQFLPSVTANSNAQTSFSEFQSTNQSGQITSGSNSNISTGLSASMDLFTGFRRGADIRSARATGDAADANLVDARSQSRLNTTTEFLNALYGSQLLSVRQASVRRAEEQLKVAVAKLASGSATRSDSLRSLVTLGTARLQLITAQADLAQAEANLGRLVGINARVRAADDSAYYQVISIVDTNALRAELRARSPRVQNTIATRNAAQATLASARSAYWPTLSLNGNYNYNGNGDNNYNLLNNRSLTLQLSWPLFNRFTRERNITTQETNLDNATAQADDAEREVQAALTAQIAQLDAARLGIEITQVSIRAAEEDLRVQQERYRLGASTIVDLLTSQEALDQAEVDAVNARFNYLRAKAQIEALIGRPL